MALNKTACATAVVAAQQALDPTATAQQRWEAALEVIFAHIKANAVVTLDATTTVTTGAGAGGLVAGTGKVTA